MNKIKRAMSKEPSFDFILKTVVSIITVSKKDVTKSMGLVNDATYQ